MCADLVPRRLQGRLYALLELGFKLPEHVYAAVQAQRAMWTEERERTEALVQGHGIDVAVERARIYNDAGCDAFLIHSKASTPDEVLRFADAYHAEGLRAPLVCVPTTYGQVTLTDLENAGFSLAIFANYSVRAAVKVLEELFARMHRSGSLAGGDELVVEMEKIFDLIFVSELKENEQRYGGEPLPATCRRPGSPRVPGRFAPPRRGRWPAPPPGRPRALA